MSRALDLTRKQVTALCEGAKKAGYIPVVQVGKVLVRLVPEEHGIPQLPKDEVDGDGKGYL